MSKTNLTILLLALAFASISISINKPYINLFAQLLEAGKGLLNSIENFTIYDDQIQSTSLTRPFKKVVHRGKVTNYRDIRTQNREEISSDLKVPFPSDPQHYIKKRKNRSPYSPPATNKEEFLFYKRLFTTLWNGGYSCDLTQCQRWDQTQGEHEGVDIVMPLNAPIQSISNGIVIEKNGNSSPYLGNYLIVLTKIDGNYYGIYYGHMNKIASDIKEGTIVSKGQTLGYVGNTGKSFGSHLHLQINKIGKGPLTKMNLSKQLNKIWTDKTSSHPITTYSVDPLDFIQQHLKPLKNSSQQLSESVKKLEKSLEPAQETQPSNEKQTPQPKKSKPKESPKPQKNSKKIDAKSLSSSTPNISNTFKLKHFPSSPTVNQKLTFQLIGDSSVDGEILVKIYTPQGQLQKHHLKKNSSLEIVPQQAGYYLISVYANNHKIAKDKVQVYPFTDIQQEKYFKQLSYLFNNKIVQGDQGRLNPDQNLTRAQLTAILMRAIYQGDSQKLEQQMQKYITQNGPFFKDVKGDEWFAPWAYMAYKLGYVKGDNGSFYPNQNVTRAQLIAIYGRTFDKQRFSQSKLRNDVTSEDWFFKYAVAARYDNLLVHKGKDFYPNQNVTRLEAFLTLYRYLKAQQKNISFSLEEINTALAY